MDLLKLRIKPATFLSRSPVIAVRPKTTRRPNPCSTRCVKTDNTPNAATVRRAHSNSHKWENAADDMDKFRVGSSNRNWWGV